MIWKQFTHLGNFPPELKARFNSFLTTEFDDSLSVEMQLRSIIKWCQGNFKTVDTLIDFINELSNWLKQFETNFDTKLGERVISVLSEWQANGKLDVVISEALQWQLDDYIATNEQDKLSLTEQLQQTTQYLSNFKTEENTWSEALQACINYCATNYCKKIKLPPHSDLIIDTPITNGGTLGAFDIIIEGDGKGVDERGSCLTYTGTGYMFTNDLTTPEVGGWRGITFKDMTIRASDNTLNGIKLVFTQQALFENVEFIGWNHAVDLTGNSHYPYFKNCRFVMCEKGVHVLEPDEPDFAWGGSNHGKIDNCFFTYCTNPLDILTEGSGWTIDNVDFEGSNGTIVLGNDNKLNNVRIERNNHLETWLKIGAYNVIDIVVGVAGGNIPQPMIEAGDKNEIKVGGDVMDLIEPTTFGNSNTLYLDKLDVFNPQSMFPFIYRLDKSNKISFVGRGDTANLLDPNITNWFKTAGVSITASTFSDDSTAYQITHSGVGTGDVSVAIPGVFASGDKLYLSFDRELVAGSNFTVQVENLTTYSIPDVFSSPVDNKKSVVGFEFNLQITNPVLHIYINGDGTAVKIGNIVANRTLNNALF